jgi:hypothetical protein
MPLYPARVSYQWKIPGAKSHHGYAMGVLEALERNEESVIASLVQKYPNLKGYEIIIIRLEWR